MTGRLGKPLAFGGRSHDGRRSMIIVVDGGRSHLKPRPGGCRFTSPEVLTQHRHQVKRLKRRARQREKRDKLAKGRRTAMDARNVG